MSGKRSILVAVVVCLAAMGSARTGGADECCTWALMKQCYRVPPSHNCCCPEPKEINEVAPTSFEAAVVASPAPDARPKVVEELVARMLERIRKDLFLAR